MSKPGEVIARNIRMRRAWLGLGVGEVASKAGLSRTSITNYEAGQSPRADKFKRVAEALGVTVEQLEDPNLYSGEGGGQHLNVDTLELLKLSQNNHIEEFRELRSRVGRIADQLNNNSARLNTYFDVMAWLGKKIKVDVYQFLDRRQRDAKSVQ